MPGAGELPSPEAGAVFKGVRILLEQNAAGGQLGSDKVMCGVTRRGLSDLVSIVLYVLYARRG